MPRIPTYQPGQVGPVQTTGARFRAADNGGGVAGALAQGMQRIGGAAADFAVSQDQINAQNDDTQARKMTVEAAGKISALTQQYKTLMGGNAREAQDKTLKEIAAIRDQYFGQATNGRMRAMLEQRLGSVYQDEVSAVTGHALREVKAERLSTLASERAMFSDRAVTEDDPLKRQQAVTMGIQALEAELNERGLMDPALRGVEVKKFTSGIHRDVIDREMTRPDRNVDMVEAYFEANKDEMTAADREAVLGDMRPLLVERQTEDDFSKAVMGMKPIAGEGELVGAPPRSQFMQRVRSAESSGNDQAKASTSSATGRYQFTSGTWLTYYKRRYGDQGLSDAQILAKRTDGKLQDTLMGDLTSDNEQALKDNGLPVTAGSLYLAHFAGSDGARRLLTASPNATAASVLGQEVVAANPFLRGKSAKEVIAWADAKMGSTKTEAPGSWDKDEAYRRIDELGDAEGWSLERRNAVKAKADKEIGKREELLARQEREANDAALEAMIGLGDNFTSINQIPREVRDSLSPEARMRYENAAKSNLDAKTKIQPNGSRSMELQIMQRLDPAAFARVDLSKEVGNVSNDELRGFMLKQADVLAKPTPAAKDHRTGIQGAITWGEKYGGVKVPKSDFPAVYDFMESQLLEIQRAKGRIDPRDYTDAFNTAMRTVRKPGLLWDGEQPLYQALTNVPPEVEQQIRDNWKGGRPPTKGEIISAYRQILTGK